MAEADTNLDLLRQAYEALAGGDFGTLMGLLADDVKAHVPGRSPVAGDYDGKAAVGGYVAKLGELSGGTLRFEPHDVTASEAHGVGLVRDLAERDGKTLAMNNVHVWHFASGRLAEIWVFPGDLYAWDDFWSD
ncbi:MAG: nuclear transport factor 2 family protein [Acidimicrobiales bacterium]